MRHDSAVGNKTWRNRGDAAWIGQVLDRGRTHRLFGQQTLWRRLVGQTLGEVTASLGVNEQGALRIMAGNEAACREVLARDSHVLAAWNAMAVRLGGRRAERLVCWVNPQVGRNARRAHPEVTPTARATEPAARPAAALDQDLARRLAPAEVADPEIGAALGRIAAKIKAASSDGSDAA